MLGVVRAVGKLWCCPAAFLVLLCSTRADVGGLNKSTANLAALAQPLNLLRRVFLQSLCQNKRGAQAELVFCLSHSRVKKTEKNL